jgi:hypothetical protein
MTKKKAVLTKPLAHYSQGGLGDLEWTWPVGTECFLVDDQHKNQDYFVLSLKDPNNENREWIHYVSRDRFELVIKEE